jgi:pimeloyl-ACP methyl ester carboxylesterase
LKKIDVPTLILHGDDDQIVPIGASALLSLRTDNQEGGERQSGWMTLGSAGGRA